MIARPATWVIGLVASAVVHAGSALALIWIVRPDPVAEQPKPETSMEIQAHQVESSRAAEQVPEIESAASGETGGTSLGQGSVAQVRARPARIRPERVESAVADGARLDPVASPGARVEEQAVSGLRAQEIRAATVDLAAFVAAPAPNVPETVPTAEPVRPARPSAPSVRPMPTPAAPSTELVAPTTRAKATLAFSGAGSGPVDPVSLVAFQSFMRPGDPGSAAADLRDGIAGLLDQVPCSRMQVQFVPETNVLQVTGHVPEDGLRGPVLAELQARMGAQIAVSDNLLILPRPQCGALAGISNAGLAQSTDQITNPLLVGKDTHARVFSYVDGQPLVLDMQGADYAAYLYVDFFDAGGNVLHLVPNAYTPLELTPPKAAVRIGSDRELEPGEPGLFIKIGPPYGQEIAVAFAASSPLYEGHRPLVEPAGDYLSWLREQIAAARERDPGFKGEWVYFFVSTAPE